MDQFLLTLLIVLFPGIVAAVISDKILVHQRWGQFKFFLYASVLGIFSYSLIEVFNIARGILCCFQIPSSHLKVWASISSTSKEIPWEEVILAMGCALPVAFFVTWIGNNKILNRIAQKIKVSQKYGDESLFSYYLNADEIVWVYIRCFDDDLLYEGRVVSYSEKDKICEIVLAEVMVYENSTAKELYSVPTMFLSKSYGKFVIEEIPKEKFGGDNGAT